jgi:hypothetical protein
VRGLVSACSFTDHAGRSDTAALSGRHVFPDEDRSASEQADLDRTFRCAVFTPVMIGKDLVCRTSAVGRTHSLQTYACACADRDHRPVRLRRLAGRVPVRPAGRGLLALVRLAAPQPPSRQLSAKGSMQGTVCD